MMRFIDEFLSEYGLSKHQDSVLERIIDLSNESTDALNSISYVIVKYDMICFLEDYYTRSSIDIKDGARKYFPWVKRINRLRNFKKYAHLRMPALVANWGNKVTWAFLSCTMAYLIYHSITNIDFFIASHPFITIFGVSAGILILPMLLFHFFLPSLIWKSSFEDIKTLDDLIRDISIINRSTLRMNDNTLLKDKLRDMLFN